LLVVADFPLASEATDAVDETVEQSRLSGVEGTHVAVSSR